MLAAAAAVAAGPVTRVLADEESKPNKSPNDRLNVAVIGVRGRGAGHLAEVMAQPNVLITHICDVDQEVGRRRVEETAGNQKHKPEYSQDLRRVLEDKSVDVVTIATPNHWHALAAIWAMQAGKDVYVEKPVSHNVSEGRRVVEAARRHARVCQTGTQCRSMVGTQEAIAYVHAGKIGDLKVARGLCYKARPSIGARGNFSPPASVDYNLWLGPAPEKAVTRPQFHYDWHWQWDYGNGDLGNQGIHQMDLARWGLGVDTLSNGVMSYGGRLGYEDAGETANTQIIVHDYGAKSLVFEVRGLPTDAYKGAGVGVIFEGTDGYLVLNSYDGGAAFDPSGAKVKEFKASGDHFANFFAAVRKREPGALSADILQGHLSSALCHLGNISYRLGSAIPLPEAQSRVDSNPEMAATFERFKSHLADNHIDLEKTSLQFGASLAFDPTNERFSGNDAANAMLTREYRAPFVVPAADAV